MDTAIIYSAGTALSMKALAIIIGSFIASTGIVFTSSGRVAESLKTKLNNPDSAVYESAERAILDHDLTGHSDRFGPALAQIRDSKIPIDTRVFDGVLSH